MTGRRIDANNAVVVVVVVVFVFVVVVVVVVAMTFFFNVVAETEAGAEVGTRMFVAENCEQKRKQSTFFRK